MAIRLDDAELAALSGQRPELWQLYIVLRTLMDYHSGFVGHTRRISWRALQEALYIEPGQGLEGTGTPTKAKVRRLAEGLERAGLVRNRSALKHLIFFLPLAITDQSAPNKPGTNPAYPSRHLRLQQRCGLRARSTHNPAGAEFERDRQSRHTSGIRYPERKDGAYAHVA
ncbi:hypothetical protein [Thiocystis violascens]|uniref:Uncharacterized protein n=1 Tax=Thiocystis violascens (strain ATCC 17096 / DSM 198 / 6111) TaxID=765911 RepID=I3Y958_THIV6|nr:hypothetical protein [Thiocystis violascens]AFL73526.1 hypothetical protein Thivi_1531 [Thiocystis violascens DSM 198]